MPKGKAISYSAGEMAWLEDNRAMVISDYYAAFQAAFDRPDVTLLNLHSLRKRMGWRTGRTGQFVKGQAAHNKGRHCEDGKGGRHPNSRATHFQAGVRQGVAAKLWKPIGTERIAKDGYLERKIHDGMPLQSRWRAVHLIEWEAANGPLPAGYALKCLDGDKMNTAPSNWEAIPRALLPLLNGGRLKKSLAFDQAPEELKPSVMLVAKVKHEVSKARKRKEAA
jgi:hypothetical protein